MTPFIPDQNTHKSRVVEVDTLCYLRNDETTIQSPGTHETEIVLDKMYSEPRIAL